ncbi:MAG: hypothetical protein K1X79_09905 [Oligoflexia bacterium]|nr:hypothetical protein [Oligoflexia bacterium]
MSKRNASPASLSKDPARAIRVHLTLAFDDVHWAQVLDLLMRRYHMSFAQANALIVSFSRRFRTVCHLSWFARSALSGHDNILIATVCECHGADSIALIGTRQLRVGPLCLNYQQNIRFSPSFRRREVIAAGSQCAAVTLSLMGHRVRIETLSAVLTLYVLLSAVAAISAALFLGALLYSVAVFLVFLDEPTSLASTATRNGPIGLALLCFLVAIAGFCGRALFNICALARKQFRHVTRCGPQEDGRSAIEQPGQNLH